MPERPSATALPFWKKKALKDMTREEWESLCDGCGRCCLNKIDYIDTGEVFFTKVACRLLDGNSCQCSNYAARKEHVPDCIVLTPETLSAIDFMPDTCAYRMLAEGRPLEPWHPLISGTKESVHQAGISVRNRVVSEEDVTSLEDYIIRWIKPIKRKKSPGKARGRKSR